MGYCLHDNDDDHGRDGTGNQKEMRLQLVPMLLMI